MNCQLLLIGHQTHHLYLIDRKAEFRNIDSIHYRLLSALEIPIESSASLKLRPAKLDEILY